MTPLRIHPGAKQWMKEKGITDLTVRQTSVLPGGCCSSGAIELLAEPGTPSRPENYQKVCSQDVEVYFPRALYQRLAAPYLVLQNYGLFKSLRVVDTAW